jgi:hypothetical protein
MSETKHALWSGSIRNKQDEKILMLDLFYNNL